MKSTLWLMLMAFLLTGLINRSVCDEKNPDESATEITDDDLDPLDLIDSSTTEILSTTEPTKLTTLTTKGLTKSLSTTAETKSSSDDDNQKSNLSGESDTNLPTTASTATSTTKSTPTKTTEATDKSIDDDDLDVMDEQTDDKNSLQNATLSGDEVTIHEISTKPTYLVIPKSTNPKDIVFYHIKPKDEKYQMHMSVNSPVHIDLRSDDCPISIKDSKSTVYECILTYNDIFLSEKVIKVDRSKLPADIKIMFELVIYGCDKVKQLRDLVMKSNMPYILHNSDHDCTFRIENDQSEAMVAVIVNSFPKKNFQRCKAQLDINNSPIKNDTNGKSQMRFDSLESTVAFPNGVYVAQKYTLLKLTNCFENEPIKIRILKHKRSTGYFQIGANRTTYNSIDSKKIFTNPKDSALLYELYNNDWRNTIKYRVLDYAFTKEKLDKYCKESPESSLSFITIYGINDYSQVFVNHFTPCDYQKIVVTIKNAFSVYVQFYRNPKENNQIHLSFDLINVEKTYRKFTAHEDTLTQQDFITLDLRNRHLDFEIEMPIGRRINLNFTKFDNGKPIKSDACVDFFIVRLNKITTIESDHDKSNPIICNSLDSMLTFNSYSNRLLITMAFDQLTENEIKDKSIRAPEFEFSYTSEKLCDNTYSELAKPFITYNSVQSVTSLNRESLECKNSIMVRSKSRRIVLYRIDWIAGDSLDEDISVSKYGKSLCRDSDSLVIDTLNPKYVKNDVDEELNQYTYCMDNPLNTLVSNNNQLFLNYNKSSKVSNKKRLVFDMGYFSYKYLYNDNDDFINVRFADIIPQNVPSKSRIDYMEIKVKLMNESNYIIPVISNCNTTFLNGSLSIRSGSKVTDFRNRICGDQTFTLMNAMPHEITFELKDISPSELRDNNVEFRMDIKKAPRIFTSLRGETFESSDFKHYFLSLSAERMTYDWTINVDESYNIKVNLDKIVNEDAIEELSITDLTNNMPLYSRDELVSNFKLDRKINYLFSSNKIKIVFTYLIKSRKTKGYPVIRAKYTTEPRIITSELSEGIQVNNTLTKNKIEWIIMAPVDNLIVAQITEIDSSPTTNGQLIFSELSSGYSSNGVYHYNFNSQFGLKSSGTDSSQDIVKYGRDTDIVVSNRNILRIQYLTGGIADKFVLKYHFAKKVHSSPMGVIKQFFNIYTHPIIEVPRLTDQNWIIRAPYGKHIQIFTKFIDLLIENPCSKSAINFYESNNTRVQSLCGHVSQNLNKIDINNFDLESIRLLSSQSNELHVQFITQNSLDAVYSVPKLESKDEADAKMNNVIQNYHGFTFYYAFLESTGDCYFQNRKNFFCGYKTLGDSSWNIVGDKENQISKNPKEEEEIEKIFCKKCYIKSVIPVESKSGKVESALMSPLLDRTKRYLKFNYKLSSSAQLTVSMVYNNEESPTKKAALSLIESSKVITTLKMSPSNSKQDKWHTIRIKIGNQLIGSYRLIFQLERLADSSSVPPATAIDNIQLFEQDLECSSSFNYNENENSFDEEDDQDMISSFDSTDNIFIAGNSSIDMLNNKFCQKYQSPCDLNGLCMNNAICLNMKPTETSEDNFKCLCKPGYTGKHCEDKINPCESSEYNRCSVNSTCIIMDSSRRIDSKQSDDYECKCDKMFHGKYCDLMIDACKTAENPCNQLIGQGECIDESSGTEMGYKCKCSPMYTGDNCETKISHRCSNDLCNKHDKKAQCIELSDDRYVCMCSSGFEGPSCTNINDCSSSPCQNNATCTDGINSFKCKCPEGFKGKYCEIATVCDECSPEGTLFCDKLNSKCVCRDTYTGDRCDNPSDPCLEGPCKHGLCVSNKIDKHECYCDPGWKGINCDKKEDICDHSKCKNGATCQLIRDEDQTTDLKYICKCPEGYEGNFCEKVIDSCSSDPCENGGSCFKAFNNYTCVCTNGYTGKNCESPIDNCLHSKCASGSTCHSVAFTYICKCPPGKFGRHCDEEEDKCLNNECINGKCIPNEISNSGDLLKSYKCQCLPGFTGRLCEVNINDCESSPCRNNATCIDLISDYRCKCKPGFVNKQCDREINYCSLLETRCDPDHTKRCIPIPGGMKCECEPRYTGARCETALDICEYKKPCRTGACVSNGFDDYHCVNCSVGYGGKNCEKMIDLCHEQTPCKNGGTCYSKPSDYFCSCPEGFTGKNCQTKIDFACIYNKCKHNSQCVSAGNSYTCKCDENYEGPYCERMKDLCKNVKCEYGYCKNGKCECDPKIIFCKKFSECNSIKCYNGGSCVDMIVNEKKTLGKCLCAPGFIGDHCETSVFCNMTRARPCGPTHQCVTVKHGYECHCDEPYYGHGCNKKLDDYLPNYETYLKEEKLTKEKMHCRFGTSKESQIFIGILALALIICAIIAFLIGHYMVLSYKKRYENASRMNIKSNYSLMTNDDLSVKDNLSQAFKTPQRNAAVNEITLNRANGFSIPRPSVRL